MNSTNAKKKAVAIAFSASLDKRNDLRNRVGKLGYSVVCFENESICFDNFEPIQPQIVIAQTDSAEVVWQFIFALLAIKVTTPLIVVSGQLKESMFLTEGLHVSVQVVALGDLGAWLAENRIHILKRNKGSLMGDYKNSLSFLLGHNSAIQDIRTMLPSIAHNLDPVLITGEQGTGKERLARLIVGLTKGGKRFLKIDCSELKPDMIAAALLTKGLGTGKKGRVLSIFLQHFDQLSMASQAEILLLIETSQKTENGSRFYNKGPIRLIAAANQNIAELVRKEKFRKDLFYRLMVIPISMPALRDRKEDIPMLMDYFLINACIEGKKCIAIPSNKAREICTMHSWPDNLDELKNQMIRVADSGSEAHLLSHASVQIQHKNDKFLLNSLAMAGLPKPFEIKDHLHVLNNMSLKGICKEYVARTERRLMKKALETTSWNRKKAAELLSISYKSMLNKMKAYDII